MPKNCDRFLAQAHGDNAPLPHPPTHPPTGTKSQSSGWANQPDVGGGREWPPTTAKAAITASQRGVRQSSSDLPQ
jgi:hypothetical protein